MQSMVMDIQTLLLKLTIPLLMESLAFSMKLFSQYLLNAGLSLNLKLVLILKIYSNKLSHTLRVVVRFLLNLILIM